MTGNEFARACEANGLRRIALDDSATAPTGANAPAVTPWTRWKIATVELLEWWRAILMHHSYFERRAICTANVHSASERCTCVRTGGARP